MIVLFYGVPGAGKTQAMQDYVSAHRDEHLFFVVDRTGEWGINDDTGAPNPRWRRNIPAIVDMPPREELDLDSFEWPENGVCRFSYPWEGFQVAELAVAIGGVTYCDDELDMAALYKDWNSSPLRHIVHRGRHMPNARGEICTLNMLGAARRPQNLHTDVSSLADEVMIFRVQGHRTLQRLQADGMVENDEEWLRIRTQPNLQYKLWRSDGSSEWGEISDAYGKQAKIARVAEPEE